MRRMKSFINVLHHNGKVAAVMDGESLRTAPLNWDRLRRAIDGSWTKSSQWAC